MRSARATRARVDAVTAECAKTAGDRVFGGVADILDNAALDAFRADVERRFGRADVLVHNAGRSRMASLDQLSDDDWTEELELKFFGLLRPTRAFLPLLRKSDAASMVYVSSLLAKQPETRLASTSAARGGALEPGQDDVVRVRAGDSRQLDSARRDRYRPVGSAAGRAARKRRDDRTRRRTSPNSPPNAASRSAASDIPTKSPPRSPFSLLRCADS